MAKNKKSGDTGLSGKNAKGEKGNKGKLQHLYALFLPGVLSKIFELLFTASLFSALHYW